MSCTEQEVITFVNRDVFSKMYLFAIVFQINRSCYAVFLGRNEQPILGYWSTTDDDSSVIFVKYILMRKSLILLHLHMYVSDSNTDNNFANILIQNMQVCLFPYVKCAVKV